VNRILTVALAATALFASPAMAQDTASTSTSTFTGPRIGANVGFADDNIFGTEAFTYGAELGYDFDVGGAVLGITGEVQDNKDITRELAVTARAGVRVGSNALLYATGGYSNIRAYGVNVDGFRLGAGAELAIGEHGFVKLEQRYGNYEYGIDLYQTLIGGGFRF
jgi:outer membrane immunogenic protein